MCLPERLSDGQPWGSLTEREGKNQWMKREMIGGNKSGWKCVRASVMIVRRGLRRERRAPNERLWVRVVRLALNRLTLTFSHVHPLLTDASADADII